MTRPTAKQALLDSSQKNFNQLVTIINQMTPEQATTPFQFDGRDRNVRDVLIHLYEWHQILLNWITENHFKHHPVDFLPIPFTDRTKADMNCKLQQCHQTTSLATAKTLVAKSHSDVLHLINHFSDTELFTPAHFDWTGNASVGNYCQTVTAIHYDWAVQQLGRHMETISIQEAR